MVTNIEKNTVKGNTDSLKHAVQADLTAFENRFDEICDNLTSSDTQRQIDAGRAFRVAAETDPTAVEPHREIVFELLTADHDSLKLSGAIAIAELAENTPTNVHEVVPDLVALLEETHAPAIEEATLRALTRIGLWSPDTIAGVDDVTAEHLRSATPPIRTAIVSHFSGVIIEAPTQFPATIDAMEKVLTDDQKQIRYRTAKALADIAAADPSAVSSVSEIQANIETMAEKVRAQHLKRGDIVIEAAEILRSICDDSDP